jgi:predicted  nucleic acid-binding Zn-ribbon protein
MNKDIATMLELQEYWDIILDSKDQVSRKEKSIKYWKDELAELQKNEEKLNNAIKENKNSIKTLELELSESEEKIKKLNERKTNIHNERELQAVTNELNLLNENRDTIEEKLIQLMDEQAENEKFLTDLTAELQEKNKQVDADTLKLQNEIRELEAVISHNDEKFNNKSGELSASVKSKFLKLIKSKEGKAIAEINGEICGFCNFTIPAFLAVEAGKEDAVSVCTNCGRYIFKRV